MNKLIQLLHNVPILAELDDRELKAIARDLQPRHFAAGETIFFQGDQGTSLYIIASGMVRIYVHGQEGQEISVRIYGPGELFGEMSLIDKRPRSATATALEDTKLWVMSDSSFYRHLHASPQLALNVMLTLSTRLRESNESFMSLASLDVTRRIAKRLLSLSVRQGKETEQGIRIASRLTQTDLASLIGASRESANRALRALQRKGLIDWQDGHIVLLKPDDLASLVGNDETWW